MDSVSGNAKSINSIQWVGTNDIAIMTGADRTMMSAYITLRYTKTTDEGNGNTIALAIEN